MIELFRTFSQSWIARGFFLLLALLFIVMWGGGDLPRQLGGGSQSVVTVGGSKISARDFSIELSRTIQQIQLSTGQVIDEEKARQFGLYDMVREKLISQKLLELEAERLGISVTDDEIKRLITADKLFQNESGDFQKTRFEAILNRLGYDEATYIAALRKDVLRGRLFDAFGSGAKGPISVALPLFAWEKEKRSLSAILLTTKDVRLNAEATEDDLKKYYEQHKDKLQAPEYRAISMLKFDQKKMMANVMLSKSDLEASFRHRSEEFSGKKFEQVQEQIEEDLKKNRTIEAFEKLINNAEDLLGQGKTLEEVAKELSLELVKYERIDANGSNDPFVTNEKLAFSPEDIKALHEAFALDLESISPPIEVTPGQSRVVRADKIEEARGRTFEEVKKKLIDFWTLSQKLDLLKDKADTLARDINSGSPAAVVASKAKLKMINAKITRTGPLAPSALELSEAVVQRLYAAGVNEAISVPYKLDETSGTYAVIQVISKETPDPKSNIKDVQKYQSQVRSAFVDDMMTLYLYALRKRFPVEINHHFFAQGKEKAKNVD